MAAQHPGEGIVEPRLDQRQLQLYRYATLSSGIFYLVWWGAVELLLPGSFNPLGSRLVVVLFCLAIFAASFYVRTIAEHMSAWFLAGLWAVTLHYFYLFSRNASDINWVVGTYVLLIAGSAVPSSVRELVAYASFVLVLSVLLVVVHPALLRTIFLSGVFTILAFAYLGLRARLRLVTLHSEAAERVQQLFDAVFEGIVLHDQGVIIDVNESFARIFGYSRRELRGMKIAALTAPESQPLVTEQIQSASLATYEAVGLRKDGSTIALELCGKQHFVEGRPIRLTAVRDLTERKRAERTRILYEAAQESLRIRDEFMLIVSHELKTPLTNLKLQVHLALREFGRGAGASGEPDLARLRGYLDHIDRQIDRLAILIGDVVDSAQIGIGKLQTAQQRMDLAELARGVVASLAPAALQAGCTLRLDAGEHLFLQADPSRLEQVLLNLLTNALKYGAGHPVMVSLQQDERTVTMAVQDQGMGISADDQERIFRRFERAVSARHISGLGLGLYICKYIVDAHGGRIEVVSEPGRGARFSVILPLSEAETSHAA